MKPHTWTVFCCFLPFAFCLVPFDFWFLIFLIFCTKKGGKEEEEEEEEIIKSRNFLSLREYKI
jgi:hypothetical protein